MTSQARYGKRHSSSRGTWLFELAVVLVVLTPLAAFIACSAGSRLQMARAQHTLIDMRSILAAGQEYHALYSVWPEDLDALNSLLSSTLKHNAWGEKYILSHMEGMMWVETDVPKGVVMPQGRWSAVVVSSSGHGSRWRLTAPVSYGLVARLVYENKQDQ